MIITSFLSFVIFHVLFRNPLHAVDLDLDVAAGGNRIGDLVDGFFVDLHAVDREAGAGVQLLVADVTLEVLGLLVLDQDLFVVELPVAVPGIKLMSGSWSDF